MIQTILFTSVLLLTMLLPYLPGRYDASAATLSFVIQVASYVSLLFVPVGLAWMVNHKRSSLWHRLTFMLAGFIVFVAVVAAVAVNQLAMGVMLGMVAIMFLRDTHRHTHANVEGIDKARNSIPLGLALVPVVLVAFIASVLPRAAEWSRERAIQHSATLIAAIDSFRQRWGHYPLSLQSLNRDIPTGIVGIERFHYEPNGETYNLFFVRISSDLDTMEVVMFNPRDEHRFTSHELDILQYSGDSLALRRGDRRRTTLAQPHWVSILFD